MKVTKRNGLPLYLLFKNQFPAEKTTYYAEVEAQVLRIKKTETVRQDALEVQQLIEKGWCKESAATINLKCSEILLRGLPKN